MNIKEIAHKVIVASGVIPAEDIIIANIVNPDWNGRPLILITSDPTQPEDETQLSIVTATTNMAIHTFAETQEETVGIANTAVNAAYKKFTELEQQRGSGIYSITFLEKHISPFEGRTEFHVKFAFRILHKLFNH